jgi:hypothetical protein
MIPSVRKLGVEATSWLARSPVARELDKLFQIVFFSRREKAEGTLARRVRAGRVGAMR